MLAQAELLRAVTADLVEQAPVAYSEAVAVVAEALEASAIQVILELQALLEILELLALQEQEQLLEALLLRTGQERQVLQVT